MGILFLLIIVVFRSDMVIERIVKNENENEEKAKLVVMIGLPGSGKSTIAAKLEKEEGYLWLSSDNIREELYGNAAEQKDSTKVFNIMKNRAIAALKNEENVVYDATNLIAKRRKSLLKNDLRNINCKKIAYIVLTDFKECRARNQKRDRVVPDKILEDMFKKIQFPWWGEGWDEIIIDKDDVEYDKTNLLYPLMEMPHDNPHHKETIGQHCFMVAKREELDNSFLKNTGLLHDIGKGFCKVYSDSKGNPTEEAHYYGHANVGAYISFFIKGRISLERKLQRAILIQWHMEHYFRDSKGMKKLEDELGPTMWRMLDKLMKADKRSCN